MAASSISVESDLVSSRGYGVQKVSLNVLVKRRFVRACPFGLCSCQGLGLRSPQRDRVNVFAFDLPIVLPILKAET
jgi:hypothetical protein